MSNFKHLTPSEHKKMSSEELSKRMRDLGLRAEALREEARSLIDEDEKQENLDIAYDCDIEMEIIDDVLSNRNL